MDGRSVVEGRRDGDGAGGARQGSGLVAASSYLEQSRKSVTEGKDQWVEIRACGCRSRFCPRCCLHLGIELKKRLKPELAKFTGLMMLTLTIDPQLFSSPLEAYEYVTRKRCIGVMIQRLYRWGLLHSRRYVAVVEWQKESEQAHWHVLVDASFIPFEKLCEAWNRNWAGWKERVAQGRPGFGSVRFSAPKLQRDRAAGYVTAYLTKHPEHGYPQWVLDGLVGKVHRFQTSRGFWTEKVAAGGSDEWSEASSPAEELPEPDEVEEAPERQRRTIREQIASCRQRCVVQLCREGLNEATGEVKSDPKFIVSVGVPLAEVLAELQAGGIEPDEVNVAGTCAVFLDCGRISRRAGIWRNGVDRRGMNGYSDHRELRKERHEDEEVGRRSDAPDHQGGVR